MQQIKQGLTVTRQFLQLLVSRFLAHGGLQRASALAYTTLLSLIPLMAVVIAIFSAFPIADQVSEKVQDFIFANFIPASGEAVQSYLAEFSSKAGHLSGISSIVLLAVALMLMSTIEKTFNDIWEVQRKRRLLGKFLVYWAVLSLGPVLIAVSVLATSYLVSLPFLVDAADSDVGKELSSWVPMVASGLAFSLMYWLVPNRSIKGWHAVLGGILAAILFEWAKQGFAFYVTSFNSYQAIYGAVAAVPIFLIWLYVSWLVVLFGAEFTHALGTFGQEQWMRGGHGSGLQARLKILLKLAQAQRDGAALSNRVLSAEVPNAEHLLIDLQQHKLVQRTDRGKWFLARKLEDMSLYQLSLISGCQLPVPDGAGWPQDEKLSAIYSRAHEKLADVMGLSLSEFKY